MPRSIPQTLDIALSYIARGWSPVPVAFRTKRPIVDDWQTLRIDAAAAPRYFGNGPINIGIGLGPDSNDLVDADLDVPEALRVAPFFLPQTLTFGRKSTPAAHWLFTASGFSFSRNALTFDDPAVTDRKKRRLLELRVGGAQAAQTVFPGSVHEEGEEIRWDGHGPADPVRIDGAELEQRVYRVAAATLLARHWPAEGIRHDTALALGGTLRRGGWSPPQIKLFTEAVVTAAGDPEVKDRIRAAADAAKAVDQDERAYGIPFLAKAVGDKVAGAAVDWLGLSSLFTLFGHSADPASTPTEGPWPTLDGAALHGLAGAVVKTIGPHTEADPVGVLLQFLAAFGACCGRTSYGMAEADRHPPQDWPVLVGISSRGRKGTSWAHVQALFEMVQQPGWIAEHFIAGGLSSGEGVIWAVRDPIRGKDKKSGAEEETDPGIKDKRLLIIEAEFASVLRQFERVGNNLSATLRALWDRGTVRSLTKNSPAKTTGAHVVVVGHVTQDELLRYLDRTELANGFANRLLLACVRRARQLPFGGSLKKEDLARLAAALRDRLADVARVGDRRCCFTLEARELWGAAYPDLTSDRPGIYGAVTARAEAHVLRLSLIYALLDEDLLGAEALIDVPHLEAALAVWRYCDASALRIFGQALGDPIADDIRSALRHAPSGMTRSDIADYFGHHRDSKALRRGLALLLQHGMARFETTPTGGRPVERWFAC